MLILQNVYRNGNFPFDTWPPLVLQTAVIQLQEAYMTHICVFI